MVDRLGLALANTPRSAALTTLIAQDQLYVRPAEPTPSGPCHGAVQHESRTSPWFFAYRQTQLAGFGERANQSAKRQENDWILSSVESASRVVDRAEHSKGSRNWMDAPACVRELDNWAAISSIALAILSRSSLLTHVYAGIFVVRDGGGLAGLCTMRLHEPLQVRALHSCARALGNASCFSRSHSATSFLRYLASLIFSCHVTLSFIPCRCAMLGVDPPR